MPASSFKKPFSLKAKVPDGFWLALRCPMGVIASQFGPKGQEHKILLVGLVGSGKTTLLHSLKAGEVRCLVTHVIVNSGHHRNGNCGLHCSLPGFFATLDSI